MSLLSFLTICPSGMVCPFFGLFFPLCMGMGQFQIFFQEILEVSNQHHQPHFLLQGTQEDYTVQPLLQLGWGHVTGFWLGIWIRNIKSDPKIYLSFSYFLSFILYRTKRTHGRCKGRHILELSLEGIIMQESPSAFIKLWYEWERNVIMSSIWELKLPLAPPAATIIYVEFFWFYLIY